MKIQTLTRYWFTVIGAALSITSLLVYSLWWWVVVPHNQQRLTQHVDAQTTQYVHAVQQYIVSIESQLKQFADTIPQAVFDPRMTGNTDVDRWLSIQGALLKKQLPDIDHLTLLSTEQINEKLYAPIPQNQQITTLNFLLIDMINHIQAGKSIFIEAAKLPGSSTWQLHHVVAVHDQDQRLAGVLHTTLSTQGLAHIFKDIDTASATVVLNQTLHDDEVLVFYIKGRLSPTHHEKTVGINNSYWQLSYRPSPMSIATLHTVPTWLVWFALTSLLLMVALAMGLRRPPTVVVEKKQVGMGRAIKPVATAGRQNTVADSDTTDAASVNQQPQKIAVVVPDSIFRAYDIRGIAHEQLSNELAYAIGQAVGSEVLLAGDDAIIVGRDARIHSQALSACMIDGLISTGCDVIDIGLVPTPLMNFAACCHAQTSSGLVVTASHNSKEYNGCKIVIKGQTLVDNDIQRVKTRIQQRDVLLSPHKGQLSTENFSQQYIDHIVGDTAVVDGLRVVIDASNGAASELAPRLFSALGCQVTPLFCEFDGNFPNHDPDPSIISHLTTLVDTVQSQKADIGLAFDGDGDRLMVVTAQGRIVWPDQLMILFVQDLVSRHPGCDVVYDIKSSQLLGRTITACGGRPVMWKTGHSHIKAKMQETQALLGGEFSGHIFFKERWFGFDDGLYAATRLLEIMTLTGQSLDELLADIPDMSSTPEIKVAVSEEQKFALVERLINEADFVGAQRITIDGLRVEFEKGWGLVRASNTAPFLTFRFEAVNLEELQKIQHCFKQELQKIAPRLELNF